MNFLYNDPSENRMEFSKLPKTTLFNINCLVTCQRLSIFALEFGLYCGFQKIKFNE